MTSSPSSRPAAGRDDRAPIAVALDAPSLTVLAEWSSAVAPVVSTLKVGLEVYCRDGGRAVQEARRAAGGDIAVFLDLKLHDIPATVRLAVQQFAGRGITFATVHGYPPMVEAALAADTGVGILAVTVLTSFGPGQAAELGCAGPVDGGSGCITGCRMD